jgi:predicted protein tyrosine phosphatase
LHDIEEGIIKELSPLKALARKRKFGTKVFIYCGSGVSRSPTVALAYLCLFKKVADWPSVTSVASTIKKMKPYSHPNISIVQQLLASKKVFLDQQEDEDKEAAHREKII